MANRHENNNTLVSKLKTEQPCLEATEFHHILYEVSTVVTLCILITFLKEQNSDTTEIYSYLRRIKLNDMNNMRPGHKWSHISQVREDKTELSNLRKFLC